MSWVRLFRHTRERVLDRLVPGRMRRRELRARWGQPGEPGKRPLADRYFARTDSRDRSPRVDDRTWNDLEFPRIFSTLDTTETPIGSQVLFARLRTYAKTAEASAQTYAVSRWLQEHRDVRERIQRVLGALQSDDYAGIADFVFGREPERPRHAWLLPLWGLASLAAFVAAIAWGWPLWIWLGMLLVNAVTVYRVSWRLYRDTHTLQHCTQLLRTGDALAALATPMLPPLQQLAEQQRERAHTRRMLRWMALLQTPVMESLAPWLTLAFLAEPIAYAATIGRFERMRPVLAATFEAIGGIDAAIAVSSFLVHRPDHCQPGIVERPLLDIRDGCHPLTPQPVANTLRLDGQSALITGSNMAGKTTFVKMVAINMILGRTLGFCLASAATLPRSEVMTSIRGQQSVASGRSHYFDEIEAVRTFLDHTASGQHPVLVIDELFRGTNTRERVALARAVLEHLGRHATVLATTHDVELQSMLDDAYVLCHFRENPDVEGFFDYRLRPGASRTHNAIRILERMDFPAEVVASAMRYAGQPDASGS